MRAVELGDGEIAFGALGRLAVGGERVPSISSIERHITMSKFENYTNTSQNYDLTRQPVGLELIFGALACGSRPLGEQTALDAGCGTGNYLAALAGKVARTAQISLEQLR